MGSFHWVWVLIGAPVAEEVIFRRGLHEALLRGLFFDRAREPLRANLVTAIAFAAAHWLVRPGYLSLLTFFPALVIGAMFNRYRRLDLCIVGHAVFNLFWLVGASRVVGRLE